MDEHMDVYKCRQIWKHSSAIRPNSKQIKAKGRGRIMMVPFSIRDPTGAVCMCGYDNLFLTCWQCICMITCPAGLKRIFIPNCPIEHGVGLHTWTFSLAPQFTWKLKGSSTVGTSVVESPMCGSGSTRQWSGPTVGKTRPYLLTLRHT